MGAQRQLDHPGVASLAHANGNGRFHQSAPEELQTLATVPGLLHEYFEAAARRWPDAIAVDVPPGRDRAERRQFTYAEIEQRAGAIAAHLRLLIGGECIVAVLTA